MVFSELTKPENTKKFLAEFAGTFILTSTVVFCVYGTAGMWAATAIAASLMVAVYSFGSVSGAHLNPAVTTAIWWGGQMENAALVLCYWTFQILGALAAAYMGTVVYHGADGKLIAPGSASKVVPALLGEFIYTFMLSFVVLNCACTKSCVGNQYYGLAIGFVIIAAGYSWGPVSGGAFNPAVLMGFNFASKSMSYSALTLMPMYIVSECLGAIAAAEVWKLVRAEDFGAKEKNTLRARCIAEFTGTFFLCFTVCSCVALGVAVTPWAAAAALMCMIYSLGNVSGAHLNPAVTFAVLLSGRHKISLSDACYYWTVQFLAGVTAGCVAESILSKSGALGPVGHFSWASVFVAEAVYTALLAFTVLSCLTMKPSEWTKDFFALAIASCVTVGGFAIGNVSGGSLNPAVSLAVESGAMLHGKGSIANFAAYGMFELVGSTLAVGSFWLTRPEEYSAARKEYDGAKV